MAAPFPLSSSVGYWLWGVHGQCGLHRLAQPQVGCIAVMGRNGNPADGNGPRGHTAIVVAFTATTVTCIESYGHHGVGIKTRPRGDWDGFVAIDGMTPFIVDKMLEWERMYDADSGTVKRVYYYAGPGDNDHDGSPDRADIYDGDPGIDCSGAVKLCADYGFDHQVPSAPPDLTTLPLQEEDMDLFATVRYPPGGDRLDTFWVDAKTGALGHRWETPQAFKKERVHPGPFKVPQRPHAYVTTGGVLVVSVISELDGKANSFTPNGIGGWSQQVMDVSA